MVIATGLKKRTKSSAPQKTAISTASHLSTPFLSQLCCYTSVENTLSGPLFPRIIPAFPARTYPLTISYKEKLLVIACPGLVLLGHF